jgi:hypothetical protein
MGVREGTISHACASSSYSNACRYAEDDLDDDSDSGKALRAALRAWHLCMNGAGEEEGLDFLVVWRNLREICWRKKGVGGRVPACSQPCDGVMDGTIDLHMLRQVVPAPGLLCACRMAGV